MQYRTFAVRAGSRFTIKTAGWTIAFSPNQEVFCHVFTGIFRASTLKMNKPSVFL